MSAWNGNSADDMFKCASALAALAPCYITGMSLFSSLTTPSDAIYYLPEGSTASSTIYGGTIIGGNGWDEWPATYLDDGSSSSTSYPVAQLIGSSYGVVTPAGSVEYVHSTNRNAYPDSGTQDGHTYTYLGVPFENAVTAPKIETGSYVGTGTYGSSNPNSLTFSFEPKLVLIPWLTYVNANKLTVFSSNKSEVASTLIPFAYTTTWLINDNGGLAFKVSEDRKTVYWYYSSNHDYQLNTSEYTYYYIAIG